LETQVKPKIYVAGPMRGLPNYNFPAFDAAAVDLRARGWAVVSPAEHDREIGVTAETPDNFTATDLRDMIMWDLDQVSRCDAVYFLRGWENSKGARTEHALAIFLGKELIYQ